MQSTCESFYSYFLICWEIFIYDKVPTTQRHDEAKHISVHQLEILAAAELKMQTDKPLNGGVYRIDAATYYKYKAIVDRNNKIIQELKAEGERKDKIIEELRMARLCFELVLASERGGKSPEE